MFRTVAWCYKNFEQLNGKKLFLNGEQIIQVFASANKNVYHVMFADKTTTSVNKGVKLQVSK